MRSRFVEERMIEWFGCRCVRKVDNYMGRNVAEGSTTTTMKAWSAFDANSFARHILRCCLVMQSHRAKSKEAWMMFGREPKSMVGEPRSRSSSWSGISHLPRRSITTDFLDVSRNDLCEDHRSQQTMQFKPLCHSAVCSFCAACMRAARVAATDTAISLLASHVDFVWILSKRHTLAILPARYE
jgi:hypothetical protein